MCKTHETPSSDEIFYYLKMFNHVLIADEDLVSRLPEGEFELSFNHQGDIFVNGNFLGVNVKQRHEALALK